MFNHAYAASASGAGFDPMSLVPLLLMMAVGYFLLIRPQQKKAQEHKKMLSEIGRGDRVLTSGGLVGQVHRVTDESLIIEIAKGVRVQVVKEMITQTLDKTFPLQLEDLDVSAKETSPTPKKKAPVRKKSAAQKAAKK